MLPQEYKNWIQTVFDSAANRYGEDGSSFFNSIGKELVNFANLNESKNVLDVATGKGAVLLPIAEKFNGCGNIYGIDLSAEMIKALTFFVAQKFSNVHLQQMDAENLTFSDNYFDTIFCAFALFFFPHTDKALREFKRVLKKDGLLYLSLWDADTYLDLLIQRVTRKFGISKKISANELHPSAEEFHQLLNEIGFTKLRIEKFTLVHHYHDLEQYWNSLWSHAYRGYLEELADNQLLQMKKEIFNELENHVNETGQLIEEMPVIFIEAKCS